MRTLSDTALFNMYFISSWFFETWESSCSTYCSTYTKRRHTISLYLHYGSQHPHITYPHYHTPYYPRDLDPDCIPMSESLQDTMERTLPLLMKRIIPDIKLGKTVLVVAHANSLRGKDVIDSFLWSCLSSQRKRNWIMKLYVKFILVCLI
jgi:hypothetical protein